MNTPQPHPAATRRRVLTWTGAGLTAALTGAWSGAARAALPAPTSPGGEDSREFSRARFAALLGAEFHIHADPENPSSSCRLVEVSPEQPVGQDVSNRFLSFSLFFSCGNPSMESKIHRLSHPDLPDLKLFLSPVGNAGAPRLLEAVISQRA